MTFRRFSLLLPLLWTLSLPLAAQEADAVEILTREIREAAAERDRARKAYLEYKSGAEEAIDELDAARGDLSRKLDGAHRQLLELQAAAEMSRAAVQRAEAELEERDQALDALRQQQVEQRQKYADVLNKLQQASGDAPALRTELDEVKSELQTTQTQLEQLQASRSQTARERDELRDMNNQLRGELTETKRAESLSNAKLTALRSRLDGLRDELGRQYEERSELEQEKIRLEEKVGTLQEELAKAMENRVPKEEMEQVRRNLAAVQAENDSLKQELAQRRDIPDLRAAYGELEKERDLLSATRKTLSTKLDRAQASLQTEQARRRELSEDNQRLQKELEAETAKRADLEEQVEDLKTNLEAAEAAGVPARELASVKKVLADMRAENLNLKTVAENQRHTVDQLATELNEEQTERREELRRLQGMLGEKLVALSDAHKEIETLKHRAALFDSVRAERSALLAKRNKARKDMRVLANHIYELREQLKESRALQDDFDRARRVNAALRARLETIETEKRDLGADKRALEQNNRRWNEQVTTLQRELETRDAQTRALREETERLRRELERLQRENAVAE